MILQRKKSAVCLRKCIGVGLHPCILLYTYVHVSAQVYIYITIRNCTVHIWQYRTYMSNYINVIFHDPLGQKNITFPFWYLIQCVFLTTDCSSCIQVYIIDSLHLMLQKGFNVYTEYYLGYSRKFNLGPEILPNIE